MIHPALIHALNHPDSACVLYPYYKVIFPCESNTNFFLINKPSLFLCQITAWPYNFYIQATVLLFKWGFVLPGIFTAFNIIFSLSCMLADLNPPHNASTCKNR